MKSLELMVERIILASRWILVVFLLGLAAALAVYAVSFLYKFAKVAGGMFTLTDSEMILAMLAMIDSALVASLIVMVMISSYENFVSHINVDGTRDRLAWFGKLDAGSLKIKLASSIVAISSIHLLQRFLEAGDYDNSKLYALVVMHMAFVVSALMLTYIDKIGSDKKAAGGH